MDFNEFEEKIREKLKKDRQEEYIKEKEILNYFNNAAPGISDGGKCIRTPLKDAYHDKG